MDAARAVEGVWMRYERPVVERRELLKGLLTFGSGPKHFYFRYRR
jgi:hypothetical protein